MILITMYKIKFFFISALFLLQQSELIIINVVIFIRDSLWGEFFGQTLRTIWETNSEISVLLLCSHCWFPCRKEAVKITHVLFYFALETTFPFPWAAISSAMATSPCSLTRCKQIHLQFARVNWFALTHSILLLHTVTSQHQKDTKLWANLAH